jgi:hypothetical protein
MIKVMISYDMQEGREKDAQEYLVNKLAPGLARLGFRVSDVLYTVWGNSPQITGAGELEDVETARSIFLSSEWKQLAHGMDEMTTNLNVRLMRSNN